ncbi:hypothetical protein [Nonomuraea sp. NPDC048826]|uniref:hypothetical protein n=1 Tax=Nonomuraea sp. NPDC048826 TaxID=3364347 RepID=UPI003710BA95
MTPSTGGEALVTAFGGRVPADVLDFFATVGEVSLPDFWNGYFIGPPEWIASVHRDRAPATIRRGSGTTEIMVFGSDGGGTLFAVPVPDGRPVYRLPPGEIAGGCHAGPETVAGTFAGFLESLVTELETYVRAGRPPSL